MELMHRTRRQDVVPTGWVRVAENRFLVRGTWPEDHSFFMPRDGLHDVLLLVESMRQSTILIGHGAYDVPMDHHFLMWGLDFTSHPEHLGLDGTRDVEMEVAFSETTQRAGRLSGMHSHVTVRRGGRTAGTGVSRIKLLSARTYARIRGDLLRATHTAAPGAGAPSHTVGRTRPEDVLLIPTSRSDRWQLRVDTGHSTLYQGRKDHVPGMVLIEAARQAAHAVMGPAALRPRQGRNAFSRYAEFRSPLWIEASPGPRENTVTVTGHQEGEEVFSSSVTGSGYGAGSRP
ncbi:ScbA/BarX family gamma-butyrolactone biosynthesis protein [Streptomyces lushanensis]|uniref:ScbA/BarX family gamma-butyrolactone biosynthesis protein n=1 Tax=Streptomyces lushanensis TaxID=1434255 RepID=UPI00082F0534|nr:ScbA/BarX family gamma-butyrolactone biosynthesis protein [Streptomyces lushanensis]